MRKQVARGLARPRPRAGPREGFSGPANMRTRGVFVASVGGGRVRERERERHAHTRVHTQREERERERERETARAGV